MIGTVATAPVFARQTKDTFPLVIVLVSHGLHQSIAVGRGVVAFGIDASVMKFGARQIRDVKEFGGFGIVGSQARVRMRNDELHQQFGVVLYHLTVDVVGPGGFFPGPTIVFEPRIDFGVLVSGKIGFGVV